MRSIYTLFVILLTSLTSVAQVEQTVIVEHFTNTKCSTCASRNPALFDLLDDYPQVLHIAYHPSAPYSSCIFSMHNPTENDARTNFYGIYGGTPRVVVQGEVIGFQSPMLNAAQLDAALGKTSDFMVSVVQSQTDNDEVSVQLVVKRVSGTNSGSPMIYGMIAEKEINYAAPNGENLHHNVFRKVLINENLNIENIGDSVVFSENYTIHSDWKADELIITVMIQDESTNAILQSAASDKLDTGASFINDREILSLDGALYPNPATDVIHLSSTLQQNFVRADYYAVTGNLVKSFSNPQSMNISDLPEGIYMAVLTDAQQKQHITRIIKK